ncbi:MAG TPA: 16S rRNA (cytosine(967)-C(5))-methyltransferase RsmB [Casimicrobiaceae bacterium]|jgi:16S rRNA (cytosine967-C5)-methyltransferase|nr:16S rRNA (cytosine(967)-C(5))-methyltransferase RsmB [Casimicrobiaceae bacterium]
MQQSQRQAVEIVARVLDGAALPAAMAAVDLGHAGPARALVQELAYGTLRHHGRLDALTRALSQKPIVDRAIALLVEVALYQIAHTRMPAFAVVDQAVDAVAAMGKPAARSLVNALLRRYLRERAALDARMAASDDPRARFSYPRWWADRVRADHPAQWAAILEAGNARPQLTLRVNARVTTRAALLARLAEAAIDARAQGVAAIVIATPAPVTTLPGYAEGAFSVQDPGAQLAAPLLGCGDGMRVLDACAAPGGKTTHILELADVAMTALDRDAARLPRVRDNLARLRLASPAVTVVAGDARDPAAWWDGRAFDRILADVPCSASGIVRRHPDAKWLRRASDIAQFTAEQDGLLAALWPLLAHGGRLLYATCSVFRAENEARIEAFMATRPEALRETLILPAEVAHEHGQVLPSAEASPHNQDGFFYALIRKA